jgi:hypothetical protein
MTTVNKAQRTANKNYNQWRVMSKYKNLSSHLRLVTVDKYVFKIRHWL